MFAIGNRIVGVGRCSEICGNYFCALVDELVEGMLSVCPRSTPDDRL